MEANGTPVSVQEPQDNEEFVWDHSKVQHFIGEHLTSLFEQSLARLLTRETFWDFLGGNSLEAAAPSKVADFVRSRGGHTVITKVRRPLQLVACAPIGTCR